MANHQSALKRIRSNEKKRIHRRYYAKTMRNAINRFREIEDKTEAEKKLPGLMKIIDKNAARHIIHKKKASNLKSSLMRQINSL
ncbi:MAG: 30S ribosomal protein S20 [Bacteroidales bacterium]